MRSKKDEQQQADRVAHRQQKKQRRQQADADDRHVANRPPNPRVLLVCEGRNTEPSYFHQFRLPSVTIRIEGGSGDPSRVVALARQLRDEALGTDEQFTQAWCVIDRDNHAHFASALQDARQLGLRVAWSNQAFEYWLLLHFEAHAGGSLPRTDYKRRLNEHLRPLGLEYDAPHLPSKIVTRELFVLFESFERGRSRQQWAIEHARRIHEEKAGIAPAQTESCTTVYELVEELQLLV